MKNVCSKLFLVAFSIILISLPLDLKSQDEIITDIAGVAVVKDGVHYIKVNYILLRSSVVLLEKIELVDNELEIVDVSYEDAKDDIEGDIGFVSTDGTETKSFKWYWKNTLAKLKVSGQYNAKVYIKPKSYKPTTVSITLGSFSNQNYQDQSNPVMLRTFEEGSEIFSPPSGLSSYGTWHETPEDGAIFFTGKNVDNFPYFNHSSTNFAGKPTLQSGSSFFAYKDISETIRMIWICQAAGKNQGPPDYKKYWDFQVHYSGIEGSSGTADVGVAKDGSPDLDNSATANAAIDITYASTKSIKSDGIQIIKNPSLDITVTNTNYVIEPVKPGDEITFEIIVMKPNISGELLPLQDAVIKIKNGIEGDINFKALTEKTDSEGKLIYKYKILEDALPRLYYIRIFAESDEVNIDPSEVVLRSVSVEGLPNLDVSVNPKTVKLMPNETKVVTVLVLDKKEPLDMSGISVIDEIIEPGVEKEIGITNSEGMFIYSINIPEEKPEGTYEVKFYAKKGMDGSTKSGPAICKVIVGNLPVLVLKVKPGTDFRLKSAETQKVDIVVTDDIKNEPIKDSEIWIIDPFMNNGKPTMIGKSDDIGMKKYDIVVPAKTANGDYIIKIAAVKDKYITSDTIYCRITVNDEPCWDYLNLTICAEGGWDPPDGTKLICNKSVTINNFLKFEGSISIDTAKLFFDCNGRCYVENIYVGGLLVKNYDIATGEFKLHFLGEDGIFTNFINSKLSNLPDICGIEIKITDLKLIGKKNSEGIDISGTITIPGLVPGCQEDGEDELPDTEISISGMKIQRNVPIYFDGFSAKSLGMGPKLCLSELLYNYDQEKDRLDFGGAIKTPAFEAGAGARFEKGKLDSVGIMGKANEGGIPFGNTGLCLIGGKGFVRGLATKPFKIKLGGIISPCISAARQFELTASLFYEHPWVIGGEIEGGAVEIPGSDFWQMNTVSTTEIDIPNRMIRWKGEVHLGTLDGSQYLFNGNGRYSVQFKKWIYAGQQTGSFTIYKYEGYDFFDWVESIVGSLPYTVATASGNFLLSGSTRHLSVSMSLLKLGTLDLTMNFNKLPSDPMFLSWQYDSRSSKTVEVKDNYLDEISGLYIKNDTINVEEATERIVVRVGSQKHAPISKLIKPDGTEVSGTLLDSTIVLSSTKDGKKSFWTLVSPIKGKWIIQLTDPEPTDSLVVYKFMAKKPFIISAIQNGKNVNISWNTDDVTISDSVEIFLDDDNSGNDGIVQLTVPALSSSASLSIDDTLTFCKFYVYGFLRNESGIKAVDYADEVLQNDKANLPAPSNISASYNPNTGIIYISWDPVNRKNVMCYNIYIVDTDGSEELYAVVYSNENSFESIIEDYEGKKIKIRTIDWGNFPGCPSAETDITTGLKEDEALKGSPENVHPIEIYPNPAENSVKVRINLMVGNNITLTLYDILGNKLGVLADGFYNSGRFHTELDLSSYRQGVYYIRLESSDFNFSEKLLIIK